ncbi:uncharacterized protein MONOS_16953 [Monocercomonoides exilis]|uniref:uncharacterized protein n=1 Tax=Monocercomonoides exilis TaxID=2049356 RepID=UPI003559AAAD|nr:hypothetical protein MONOS_16953 [Monocercomonoides exilis]
MEGMDGIGEMRCWRRGCLRDGDGGGFGGGDGIGDGYGEGKGKGKRKSNEKGKGKGKKKKRMRMRMRKMKEKGMEENEEWEMEKEAGIGEWVSERRLFEVEKRGKERMAGWWVVREKFVRAREAWAERKSGDFAAWLTWQVEEQMVADEWCWTVRSGQSPRGMMLSWVTHKEVLMIFKLV